MLIRYPPLQPGLTPPLHRGHTPALLPPIHARPSVEHRAQHKEVLRRGDEEGTAEGQWGDEDGIVQGESSGWERQWGGQRDEGQGMNVWGGTGQGSWAGVTGNRAGNSRGSEAQEEEEEEEEEEVTVNHPPLRQLPAPLLLRRGARQGTPRQEQVNGRARARGILKNRDR